MTLGGSRIPTSFRYELFGLWAQVCVGLDQFRQVFGSLLEGGVGCVVDCVRGVGVRGVVEPPS